MYTSSKHLVVCAEAPSIMWVAKKHFTLEKGVKDIDVLTKKWKVALIETKQDCKSSQASGCFAWECLSTSLCLRSCSFELYETWNSAHGWPLDCITECGLLQLTFNWIYQLLPSLLTWATTHLQHPEPDRLPHFYIGCEIIANYSFKNENFMQIWAPISLAYLCRVLGSGQNLMPAHFLWCRFCHEMFIQC